MHLPPELANVDEDYIRAVGQDKLVHDKFQTAQIAAAEAQQRLDAARVQLDAERKQLIDFQRELTGAISSGKPLKALQHDVNGCQANISSFETLVETAMKYVELKKAEAWNSGVPISSAELAVRQARFNQLIVHLARTLVPAIPLARELDRLSHSLGVGLHESGYIFDFERPYIGRYQVADDGSLSFFLR